MKTPLRLAALPLFVALAACGTAKAGDAVRPKDITAESALGAPAPVCKGEPKYAKPYVVDLDPSIRGELEVAMKKGVVVVGYDCSSLRVLPTCRMAEGAYEYAGVQPKEKVVQVKNADELSATMPFSSGKLGGEVKSGRSIDLALVLIGLKSTPVYKVKREELAGDCEGATHFIQTAELGAFSMATGSAGHVAVAADLFKVSASGSSDSSRNTTSRDGDIEACHKADPDAPSPPAMCRGPLTLQLQPLTGKAAEEKPQPKADKDAPKPVENPCREGYLYADGICTKTPETAHLCAPRDYDDCLAQCEKGSAESCFNYAANVGLDFPTRKTFDKKACDLGFPDGCGDYAIFDKLEAKTDPPDSPRRMAGLKLAQQGCDAGGGKSCYVAGLLLYGYDSDSLKDLPAGKRAWERGCALGNGQACYRLASLYTFGTSDERVKKDMAKAVAYQERACQNDDLECNKLAEMLIEAEPPLRDLDRAARLLTTQCNRLPQFGCGGELPLMARTGHDAETLAMAKLSCESSVYTCKMLGDFYAEGKITKKDPAKAREAYTKGCDGGKGDKDACDALKGGGKAPAKKAAQKGAKPATKPKKK